MRLSVCGCFEFEISVISSGVEGSSSSGVEGLGVRVEGLGFRVEGLGFRVRV